MHIFFVMTPPFVSKKTTSLTCLRWDYLWWSHIYAVFKVTEHWALITCTHLAQHHSHDLSSQGHIWLSAPCNFINEAHSHTILQIQTQPAQRLKAQLHLHLSTEWIVPPVMPLLWEQDDEKLYLRGQETVTFTGIVQTTTPSSSFYIHIHLHILIETWRRDKIPPYHHCL